LSGSRPRGDLLVLPPAPLAAARATSSQALKASGGPVPGPSGSRTETLQAEREWLANYRQFRNGSYIRNAKKSSLALSADPTTSLPMGDPGGEEITAVELSLAI